MFCCRKEEIDFQARLKQDESAPLIFKIKDESESCFKKSPWIWKGITVFASTTVPAAAVGVPLILTEHNIALTVIITAITGVAGLTSSMLAISLSQDSDPYIGLGRDSCWRNSDSDSDEDVDSRRPAPTNV